MKKQKPQKFSSFEDLKELKTKIENIEKSVNVKLPKINLEIKN